MGIKGIYEEIGTDPRISLAKLSIEKFEDTGRPLRLAIDISIWNFQAQSAQGGQNPALRLLYFRLLRLLSLSIQAVFVFDGPKRPLQKRGQTRGEYGGNNHDERRVKTLIKLLGFEVHQALGEAEAECALLQKKEVVDAVWSEDVDTLMFGATLTFKGWAAEGGTNGPPTHVSVYDARETKKSSGLDPEGMILVALMSGGDYDTDGIPGCGAKRACEAARAGFGKKLCALDADDGEGLEEWRRELAHELRTNESKFFSRKSKAITIPNDFPRKEIFRFYTHPAASSDADVRRLKDKLVWDRPMDVAGLREYVEDVFAWTGKTGAKKMIRGLAPAMLVYKLRERYNRRRSSHNDLVLTAANEQDFVRNITGERNHFSTDGILELRILYQPSFMVPWDLDAEIDNENPEEGDEDENNYENRSDPGSPSKNRSPVRRNLEIYDPTKLGRVWIPRSIAMVGVPLKVQDYEDEKMLKEMGVASAKKTKAKPAVRKPVKAKGGMQPGALDRFLRVSKPMQPTKEKSSSPVREPEKIDRRPSPPVWLAPLLEEQSSKSSKEPEKPTVRGGSPIPVYEGPPPLQQKIEREGFVIQKSHSPNVRPRREYRKVSSQSVGTKQATLSAFKITKSNKQQNSSQKGDSSPLRHHSTSFTSFVISDDEDEDPFNVPSSQGKKHPRNPTPPSPSPLHVESFAKQPSSPALPAKKRAPLARSKTVIADSSSEDEELPKLRSIFPQRKQKGFRKSISDPTAMIGSPSVFAPKEKREIIDLLSSPIASPKFSSPLPIPQFSSSPAIEKVEREIGRASPRHDSLPQLTDDDSYHTARESLPLPETSHTSSHTTYDLPENAPTPIAKAKHRHDPRTSNPFSLGAAIGKQKRFMAPRESLPGAWKEYTEEEVQKEEKRGRGRGRFVRKTGVEVLDLTGDTD